MNRLQTEQRRLFLSPLSEAHKTGSQEPGLITLHGQVRALVLEVSRPADWQALCRVWKGVQVDLSLPAPAIAVNGIDGYQLWFSLVEPVPVVQAQVFLGHLRQHYLGDIAAERVRMLPTHDESGASKVKDADLIPAQQEKTGYWSAFVSADLASIFADDPWLDRSPGADAQADLLCRLHRISSADFQLALNQIKPVQAKSSQLSTNPLANTLSDGGDRLGSARQALGNELGPQHFLLQVMNDPEVELHWRIEAAKALLPYST